jgi:TonB family protein
MTAGEQPPGQEQPSRRRGARYRVQTPVDVTVLRSGIPDTLPGRSVNLGEGGVAAVLAGEVSPGESVGVEISLPLVTGLLRTRALVRHHDKLRSGLEFVGLSAEQRAAIRDWAGETKAEPELGVWPKVTIEAAASRSLETGGVSGGAQPPVRKRGGLTTTVFLAIAAILVALFWWRWNRGWEDLESSLRTREVSAQPQTHVPADVMERLVTHRVDPDYPEAARAGKLHGVIVLDVVVGQDGSVVDVHPLNGPEVLAHAAADALRWWRFEPYRVGGKPGVVETTVAVEFK